MPRPRGPCGLTPVLLGVAVMASSGGRAEPARACVVTGASRGSHTDGTDASTKIEIASGERRWTARIGAAPATRDFLAQLPLKLTLQDFGGNEKIADLPRPLTREGAPGAIAPNAGDVTFDVPWGNLAIFYRNGHPSPGLILLGRIVGDAVTLAGARPIAVSIRAVVAPSSD